MAIRPKKQMPANKGETGGGAPRGGSSNVRVIPGGTMPPRPKPSTPKSGPTMRSTAKDKPLSAKKNAKGNKAGLKAANKPLKSKSADEARAKAAGRAQDTFPSKRTPAQKLALRRGLGGGLRGGAGGMNINSLKK